MRKDLEYIDNQEFNQLKELKEAEYELCQFTSCNFNEFNLTGYSFLECEFIDCDLSLVKLDNASFKDVRFTNCKLLGVRFEDCNPFLFKVYFENCLLNMASFYKMKLMGQIFKNCSLHECDFSESDISKGYFTGSDLSGAVFDNTNLSGAVFLDARNYSIHPMHNNIKKAHFSKDSLIGLLDFADIKVD
jgi:uncharacterized protein YjbI with pentapeptide repeats